VCCDAGTLCRPARSRCRTACCWTGWWCRRWSASSSVCCGCTSAARWSPTFRVRVPTAGRSTACTITTTGVPLLWWCPLRRHRRRAVVPPRHRVDVLVDPRPLAGRDEPPRLHQPAPAVDEQRVAPVHSGLVGYKSRRDSNLDLSNFPTDRHVCKFSRQIGDYVR